MLYDRHRTLHHHELAAMDATKWKGVVNHTHMIVLLLQLLEMLRRSMYLVHVVSSSIVPTRQPSNRPGGASAPHHRIACWRRHSQHRGSLRRGAVKHDRSVARRGRNGRLGDQRNSHCRNTQMMPASRHRLGGPNNVFSRRNRHKGQDRRAKKSANQAQWRMRVGGMRRDRHGPMRSALHGMVHERFFCVDSHERKRTRRHT